MSGMNTRTLCIIKLALVCDSLCTLLSLLHSSALSNTAYHQRSRNAVVAPSSSSTWQLQQQKQPLPRYKLRYHDNAWHVQMCIILFWPHIPAFHPQVVETKGNSPWIQLLKIFSSWRNKCRETEIGPIFHNPKIISEKGQRIYTIHGNLVATSVPMLVYRESSTIRSEIWHIC